MRRCAQLLVLLACSLTAADLFGGTAAEAHSDDGVMTVIETRETGPRTVHLAVGIVYANDQDLAEGATVTATGTGPDGAALPATPLPRTSGARYEADLTLPAAGAWTFTITSAGPAATATTTVDVTPETTTTTTEPATTTTSRTSTTSSADDGNPTETSDDSGSTPTGLIVGGIVAAVVVVAAGLALRRSRQAPT